MHFIRITDIQENDHIDEKLERLRAIDTSPANMIYFITLVLD